MANSDVSGKVRRPVAASLIGVPALALLAFILPELGSGATKLSGLVSAPITLILYGAGIVAVRELSRRSAAGLACAALLGVTYALVEEGDALGTLFSPTFPGVDAWGGRTLGVNWSWSIYIIAFHVVISVLVPIITLELILKRSRYLPWMSPFGVGVIGVLWLVAALVMTSYFHSHPMNGWEPSTGQLAGAGAAAVIVAGLAATVGRHPKKTSPSGQTVDPPRPLWVAGVVLLLAAAWVASGDLPAPLKAYPLALGVVAIQLALAGLAARLFLGWWRSLGWTDTHTAFALWALIAVETVQGAAYVSGQSALDRIGQLAAGLVAAAAVLLGLNNSRRESTGQNLEGLA